MNEDGLVKELPCNPESMFQFHALWHMLSAACTFTMYLFLRSRCIVYEHDEHQTVPMVHPYVEQAKEEVQAAEPSEDDPLQDQTNQIQT